MIFNTSLRQGAVPKDWQHANVCPIYKKGDPTSPGNYRPVSLTSIPCKIMEHIISNQINRHLEHHKILTDAQHGFRQRRSCESQLVSTIGDFISAIEDKSQTDIVLLDFSKAFDKVSHRLLLHKLYHYGIEGHVLMNWIHAFLSNRTQEVIVDGSHSQKCGVSSGVPQGSVLLPPLYQ